MKIAYGTYALPDISLEQAIPPEIVPWHSHLER